MTEQQTAQLQAANKVLQDLKDATLSGEAITHVLLLRIIQLLEELKK